MPRSVYWPLLHMSFSPALHCGHLPQGRRTVATHDPALGVLAAAAHVVLAGLALRADAAGATDGRDDEIAGLPALHLLADLFDDPEVLVTEDQELVAVGRLAVEPVVDLGVGTAQPDAEHLHSDLVRCQFRIRHVAHVNRVLLARLDDDRFHVDLSVCAHLSHGETTQKICAAPRSRRTYKP